MNSSELEKLLGASEEKSFDLRGALYAVRDRLWIAVLVLLLVGTVAAVYVSRAPLNFAAPTVPLVQEEESKVVKIDGVNSENLRSAELLNTLIQSMQSREVLRNVVESLKLDTDAAFLQGTGMQTTSREGALGLLAKALKVEQRKNTRLVDIVIEHRDPEVARKVADSVAHEFLRKRFEQRTSDTGAANEFLVKESNQLKEKLEKSEAALHEYKVSHNAFGLEDTQNTIVQQLKELNSKLTEIKSERLQLEGDMVRAKQIAGNPKELILLSSVAANPTVAKLGQEIQAKKAEIAALAQRYKPKHPTYIAAEAELTNLREQLDTAVLAAAELLNASYRTAVETEAEFARASQEQEKKAAELNQKALQYNVLNREMESNRAMYQSLLARLKETDVTKSLDDAPVRVAEPAFAYGPIRPNKPQIMTAALLGGLIFGLGLAYALSLTDSSLKTVDECEQVLGLPILAAIPRTKAVCNSEAMLPIIGEPKGPVAEAFRTLRSSLALLGREEERRIFLFTSALPAEGKSFSCCNYAVATAQLGVSTLLIDADLRRPSISPIFFDKAKSPGLSDCLAGRATLAAAVCPTDIKDLQILPAGSVAPNPAELLASPEFASLVEQASKQYQRIIIDSAPINAVSDTLMLAPHVQTVCVVVRAGSTPRKAVQRACKALADIKCKPAGVILNYLPERHGAGYYYYYSAGEYGSEGVYGTAGAKSG
jgi:capsular exopolysaccharide synthesis family protein